MFSSRVHVTSPKGCLPYSGSGRSPRLHQHRSRLCRVGISNVTLNRVGWPSHTVEFSEWYRMYIMPLWSVLRRKALRQYCHVSAVWKSKGCEGCCVALHCFTSSSAFCPKWWEFGLVSCLKSSLFYFCHGRAKRQFTSWIVLCDVSDFWATLARQCWVYTSKRAKSL